MPAKSRSRSVTAPLRWLLLILFGAFAGDICAAPQDTRVIVLEDFETYTNTAALRSVWSGGNAELETPAPGGGKAASHDGGDLNYSVSFSVRPDAEHNVVFSADIFDFATNDQKRVTVAMRNTSGANLEFGYIYEVFPYALRVIGFAAETQWISFDPALKPVRGWHRFQATISLTNTVVTLDLGADGRIEKTLSFAGPPPTRPFTAIRFGGLPGRKSRGGPALIDNIRLALEPIRETALVAARAEVSPAPATTAAQPTPDSVPATNTTTPRVSFATSVETGPGSALWWIVGALAVIIMLLGGLLLMLRSSHLTHRPPAALLPGTAASLSGSDIATAGPNKTVRDQAVAEITEFAKQSLVQGLYSQRMALLETQKKAQQEIIELEARLGVLQLPLQDRIRAYEKRIIELESELGSRGEEMRELTQITIRLVREKLEEEKQRERLGNRFN